jgi:hypothetical protein
LMGRTPVGFAGVKEFAVLLTLLPRVKAS